jgi:hypothetical protein
VRANSPGKKIGATPIFRGRTAHEHPRARSSHEFAGVADEGPISTGWTLLAKRYPGGFFSLPELPS